MRGSVPLCQFSIVPFCLGLWSTCNTGSWAISKLFLWKMRCGERKGSLQTLCHAQCRKKLGMLAHLICSLFHVPCAMRAAGFSFTCFASCFPRGLLVARVVFVGSFSKKRLIDDLDLCALTTKKIKK